VARETEEGKPKNRMVPNIEHIHADLELMTFLYLVLFIIEKSHLLERTTKSVPRVLP